MNIARLPGAELIAEGLRDLAGRVESDAAWLVLIGAPRLTALGLVVPAAPAAWLEAPLDPSPEHRLYVRLAQSHPDSAHSRYNALIRMLVSFERAGECAR